MTTNQLALSLTSLDAKTQKVIISMATKDKVERQNILTTLQQIQAGQLLSAVDAKTIITESQLTAKQKERLLSQLGINQAVAQNTTINVANAIEQISASKGISAAKKEELIATLSNLEATRAQTVANNGLSTSMKALSASMGWIGWLSILLSFLPMLISGIKAVSNSTETLTEKFETTSEELKTLTNEVSEIKDELNTVNEKILAIESSGTLTFTSSSELANLKAQRSELEQMLSIKEQLQSDKNTINQNNFVNLVSSDFQENVVLKSSGWGAGKTFKKNSWAHIGYKFLDMFGSLGSEVGQVSEASNQFEALDQQIDLLQRYEGKVLDTYHQSIVDNAKSSLTSKASQYTEWMDSLGDYQYGTNKEVDATIDKINGFLDRYLASTGQVGNLFERVYSSGKYEEAHDAIQGLADKGELSADSLNRLYNESKNVKSFIDYLISLNTIDWKSLLGDDDDGDGKPDWMNFDINQDGFIDSTEAAAAASKNWAKVMPLLANELQATEKAATQASVSNFKLADAYDNIKNASSSVINAYEDMSENGYIAIDHLFDLIDTYPELLDNLVEENGEYRIANNLLEDKFELIKQLKIAEYTASKEAIANSKKELEAKIKINKEELEALKFQARKRLREVYMKKGAQAAAKDKTFLAMAQEITEIENAEKKLAEYESYVKKIEILQNLNIQDLLSGSGSKGTQKTEAEKYFDQLDYWLETNKITELKYYQDLAYYANQYYEQGKISLDEYASHTQKVYDWLKEQRKKDFEDDIEKLEKKKDAVSEYYDNLREQIENAHDEEDYEKEQSEKRKEIFDLDMQIAELMRDGSEKAKARIAELEEERLKAEEELFDFETDKAREDELSRLEKEQKAEEDKIQAEIDKIDGDLKSIDENITKARQDIINYAKAKGVILDFAHASGTRSSPGGFGRINEKGIEMISAPDGNGNYVPMLPSSYVFSAKATEFLWKLATEHSLPQAMYNSIAKSIKTQSSTPSVNIAQPITITMGDVIIKGNADKQTVADIKKQQENTVRMVLQKIKELQK